jgi:hypothetical protein
MDKMKTHLMFVVLAAALTAVAGCAPTTSLDDARTAYFATVDGSNEDCDGWLEWCIDEGYPQADCEERNEYCVDGEWVRGEAGDSDDPCAPIAEAAYNDCLEAGGSDEECREAGGEAYEECAGD